MKYRSALLGRARHLVGNNVLTFRCIAYKPRVLCAPFHLIGFHVYRCTFPFPLRFSLQQLVLKHLYEVHAREPCST